MLNKFGNIRLQVASILNKLIGQNLDNVLFTPDNTFKNGGANRHRSKYDMMTTGNWYARAEESTGTKFIWVDCVGLTMTDFIKEYNAGKIIVTKSTNDKIDQFTLYKNEPILKIYGYVKSIDKENNRINLFLSDWIELVSIPITKKTPKWLLSDDRIVSFRSKVYLHWRNLKKELIENADWDPVWKTFKFERELIESELEDFPSIFYY